MNNVYDELMARGMIEQVTDEAALKKKLSAPIQSIYAGFDPTADSLHVGHLLPIMALAQMQRHGHRPIFVVGGATGMIGDPSGKSEERVLLTAEDVEHNAECIQKQLEQFVSFDGDTAAVMTNNYEWTSKFSYIDWLREVGKHFSVNTMLAKESVKRRLDGRDQGISYTEFSYQVLQAYDFLHLFETLNCTIQIGGNDQWGNITAGMDLIRKKKQADAFGMTLPLVTTSNGEKFGKTAGNAVWLDPKRTSPYDFYQYWIRCEDNDVARFLKFFTFLPVEEIDAIAEAHMQAPEKRVGQKRLAEEVTRLVHGESGLKIAQKATEILFGGDIENISDGELLSIFADVPSTEIPREQLQSGIGIIELLTTTGVCKSNGDARRQLKGNAVNLNNRRVTDMNRMVTPDDLAGESTMVLRMGKKRYHVVKFV